MPLRFVKSESTFTYFEATRGYLEKHGKPLALYSDKASVFRINNKNATGGDGYTQVPDECAHSGTLPYG